MSTAQPVTGHGARGTATSTGHRHLGLALIVIATAQLMAAVSAQLVPRTGARPLMLAGSLVAAGGLFWLSRVSEHSHYLGGLLGPMLVTAVGMGLLFMPITLVALSGVGDADAGVASSLLNTGQQVGGSLGLAILGTVAWTVVADSVRGQMAAAAAGAGHAASAAGQGKAAAVPTAVYHHALAAGFSRGFLVSAGIALLAFLVALVAIRVRRSDLSGVQAPGMAAPAVEPA